MYDSYVNVYFIYSSDDIENQCKYSKNEFKTVIFILTLLKIIILKSNILRFYACGHTANYYMKGSKCHYSKSQNDHQISVFGRRIYIENS